MKQKNPKDIQIRQANKSDTEALAALIAEPGFDYPTGIFDVRRRLADLLRKGDCILIAVCEDKIVGMALLHRTYFLHRKPDGRISSLVVSESYRSYGIGSLLIKASEAVFRRWGCGRVEVTSGSKREAAHRFYLREGYIEYAKRFIKRLSE